MIYETTKLALEKLFPEPEVVEPAEVEEAEEVAAEAGEAGEETEKKAPKKKKEEAEPRPDGLVERDYSVHGYHLDAQVPPEKLIEAVTIVDENEFFIEAITGVDWIKEDQFEVIYDFSRYDFEVCRVVIRTRIPRSEAKLPTITEIYAGANWHERETAEFFGIEFTGHPHLIPLLLPEDADFHPLRKDFKA